MALVSPSQDDPAQTLSAYPWPLARQGSRSAILPKVSYCDGTAPKSSKRAPEFTNTMLSPAPKRPASLRAGGQPKAPRSPFLPPISGKRAGPPPRRPLKLEDPLKVSHGGEVATVSQHDRFHYSMELSWQTFKLGGI